MNVTLMQKKLLAEFLGTFLLVFGGCGSAVISAAFPQLGIGFYGRCSGVRVDRAHWRLRLRTGIRRSLQSSGVARLGCRWTIFVEAARALCRYPGFGRDGGGGGALHRRLGNIDFSLAGGFAANGYNEHSPAGYTLQSGFVVETILTAFFLLVILGSTESRVPPGFAAIAIGLSLTLIHLVSIPVTNTSVNPARSTGQALFVGGWALEQLWLFWAAPLIGGLLGAVIHRFALAEK